MTKFEPGVPAGGEFISLSVPEVRGNEWKYVKECLDTGWVSSVGSYVDRFEQAMAEHTGCRRAVATVNGTSALHVALRVAGVQADDEVLVSDLTFIAPVNSIRYAVRGRCLSTLSRTTGRWIPNRSVIFCTRAAIGRTGSCETKRRDAESRTTPGRHSRPSCRNGPDPGTARNFNLAVIEDASESLGAEYKGQRLGSRGDIACFSFNGNKLITTGGGGMIVTDNEAWADKAKYLTTQAKDDPLEYIHCEIGYNYRLTNVLAAIGVAQMEKLDEYVGIKRHTADAYSRMLGDLPGVQPMREAPWAKSTFWMYTVLIDESAFGMNSRCLLKKLAAEKIQARPLWQPMHASPAYAGLHQYAGPVADRLYRTALSLPCSVGLTGEQLERVAGTVRGLANMQP